ncbi:MAG TPA: mechanosensitive ion channel family protein [Polyangiaceae bacterium]|nr:mechanosensitive ion channel family protein [Polyangiaceae bacterium]
MSPAEVGSAAPPASPGASPSASASGAASASRPGAPPALVRIRDRKVFPVLAARGGQAAEARARAASQLLEKALEEKDGGEVRVEEQGDVAVVFVGKKPLIQLGAEDVAASGDASLSVHAAAVAGQVRDALDAERQRNAIAKTVFSISVLIFSALVALLLAREVGRLAARAQAWLESNPERVPELRFRGIEVIRGAAWRGLLAISLVLGRIFAVFAIAYTWLLVALSLFDSTRPYTDQLSGIVFAPLSSATQRVVGSLPALVVVGLALGATLVAVRFLRIFFGSVERGEADPAWLPREFARPTGLLVRAAVWLALVLFVLPTLTGSFDGALARAGAVALLAVGLGAAPLLASAAVGVGAVYGRWLRPGARVEIGGRRGRVTQVTLTEVRLEDDEGGEVRVPHLMTLAHPTRFGDVTRQTRFELTVSATAGQRALRELLLRSASSLGASADVELVRLDEGGARYRVTVRGAGDASPEGLACALADALREAKVPLGRATRPSEPPAGGGAGG